VRLPRLLWVRCSHNAEHALKAADLLIQGGGFGLVAMDLGDTPPESARRISLTSWFRLRRAVEHTPTVLVTVARQSNAKTCASLVLECARERVVWSGARGTSRLLRGMRVRAASTERSKTCSPVFTAAAI
jgi:recombination protein RecA